MKQGPRHQLVKILDLLERRILLHSAAMHSCRKEHGDWEVPWEERACRQLAWFLFMVRHQRQAMIRRNKELHRTEDPSTAWQGLDQSSMAHESCVRKHSGTLDFEDDAWLGSAVRTQ